MTEKKFNPEDVIGKPYRRGMLPYGGGVARGRISFAVSEGRVPGRYEAPPIDYENPPRSLNHDTVGIHEQSNHFSGYTYLLHLR